MVFWVYAPEFGEGWLEVWQLMNVCPFVGSWGAMKLENFEDLINLRISIEEGSLLNEFGEYASNSPDINS